MTSVWVHPRLGEVTLSQSMRARRVSISVRATGLVRLSFPRGVSQKRALAFLDEKAEWIEAVRERLARKRAALPPQLSPAEQKAHVEELRRAARADLPGPHCAVVGGDGAEIRKTYDSRLAYEVGELLGPQPYLAEPFPDDFAGAFARLRHYPRTLPHGSSQPFAAVSRLGRPTGRGATKKPLTGS